MCSSRPTISGPSLTSARWFAKTRTASANAEMSFTARRSATRPSGCRSRWAVAWLPRRVRARRGIGCKSKCTRRLRFATSHLRSCRGCGSALARRPVRGARTAHRRSRDGRARDRRRHRRSLLRLAPRRARRRLHGGRGADRGGRRERAQRRVPRGGRGSGPPGRHRALRPRHRGRHLPRDAGLGAARSTRSPTRSEPRSTSRASGTCASRGSRRSSSTRASSSRPCAPTTLPAEWVDEGDLPAIVRAPGRVGVFSPPDGTMQPARWVRAFSRAIEHRGVRIFERSPVPEPLEAARNGGFAVRAGDGTVHAQRVVVAADGALPQLVPAYAPAVRTKRLHMVATAPIPERVVPCAIGIRWGFEYLQQRPDGRDRDRRLLGPRRRARGGLVHDRRAGVAAGARSHRALPARRARHRRADHAPLDRPRRLLARSARLRRRRCRSTTASSSPAATTARAT